MKKNDNLSPEWDELLSNGLIEPSVDFQQRVMQRVEQEELAPVQVPSLISRVANAVQIGFVLLGAIAAGWQTLGFIFGLWATSLAI